MKLERISLGWRGGVAVQLRGLAIYEDQAAKLEPLVAIDSASAVVRLLPLLHKDPFDRMIAGTARRLQRPLITKDAEMTDSGPLETVW